MGPVPVLEVVDSLARLGRELDVRLLLEWEAESAWVANMGADCPKMGLVEAEEAAVPGCSSAGFLTRLRIQRLRLT